MSNLSDLIPAGASGKTIEAVATANITSKAPVILNSAGTVTQVAETTTNYTEDLDQTKNFVGGTLNQQSYAVFNKTGDKICAVYNDYYASSYLRVRVGTISGESISWGGATIVTSSSSSGGGIWASPHDENEFLIWNSSGSDLRTLTISSGTSFSLGTPVAPVDFYGGGVAYDTVTAGKFAIVSGTGAGAGRCVIGTISSGAITISTTNNSYTSAAASNPIYNQVCYNADGNVIVTCRAQGAATENLEVRRGVVSGDTVTFDAYSVVDSATLLVQDQNTISTNICSYDTVAGDYLFVYGQYISTNLACAKTGSLSGSTWTFTAVATTASGADHVNGIISSGMSMGLAQYQGTSERMTVCPITISASRVCTFGSETEINTNANNSLNNLDLAQWAGSPSGFYLNAYVAETPSPDRAKISFSQVAGSITTSTLTATNFVGIADAAISSAATGTVVVQGGTVIEFGGIAAATGGTITTDGDYKVHTFTSSGTFEVTSVTNNPTFDILQIAGGGGGGRRRGGGGGAGGYLYETGVSISAGLYGVTVGAGGTGAPSGSGSSTNGGDSSIDSLLAVSVGGGGGGGNSHGASGGSGGGGQGMTAGINAGTATSGQGNAGIAGSNLSYGGGGGGSGGAGSTKDGGAGTANSITGSPVTRAGGGGAWDAGAAGSGGASAGGTGTSAASNATANTGSGGGGGGDDAAGGDGGSGVVIVRYKFQGDQGSFSIGSKYYVQDDGTITTVSSSVKAGLAISTTSLLLNGDS